VNKGSQQQETRSPPSRTRSRNSIVSINCLQISYIPRLQHQFTWRIYSPEKGRKEVYSLAIRQLNSNTHFLGLSTDVKPISASLAVGSTFYETDTGERFIYTGASWEWFHFEKHILKGIATGGSLTTVEDDTKNIEVNALVGFAIIVKIDGIDFVRIITANTATEITFPDLVAAVAASVVVGNPLAAEITVTAATKGAAGNDYTIEIVSGVGNNVPLSAALVGDVLTVILATDGAGALDPAANTGVNVAAAVDLLPEFTCVMSGAGGPMPVIPSTSFTGGIDEVAASAGDFYRIIKPV
jgi:hypothetical protein